MKLTNEIQIHEFLSAVDKASAAVYLRSEAGDCYNLKSPLSRYVAIGALLSEHGDELELFCDARVDEQLFMKFFYEHPETL